MADGVDHFVGRQDAVRRLADVLTGRERADAKLRIQSIEGPGGIGKTWLFNHVLATTDLADRKYLTLRIDGNDPAAGSVVHAVARMVHSAKAEAIRGRLPRHCFPNVDRTTKAIETIRSEAVAEFQKRQPNNEDGLAALLQFLDLTIALGKPLNDVYPNTKKYVNVQEVERAKRLLEEVVPVLVSLHKETAWFWEQLGISDWIGLRNSIKENALPPIAKALVKDLSAILYYRSEEWYKPAHSKIKGIDRLLLVIDDYEILQESLGEFLVGHLLPALLEASFQSTVIILGRDQLEATHPAWDHHFRANVLNRVALDPLSRAEMDELVESFGVRSPDEKERAWRDTQGYPFYVQLWKDEAESGGLGAVMLMRFHDRTTRWMGNREKWWLQHTLLLAEVNKRTLLAMLGSEAEAEEAFDWFKREGSVRDTAGSSFRVREYLRSRLVDYLRASDPDRCEELERRSRSV